MNMEEVKGDREAHELWGRLMREIPKLFQGTLPYTRVSLSLHHFMHLPCQLIFTSYVALGHNCLGVEVRPALLHGDLWSGNVAQTTAECQPADESTSASSSSSSSSSASASSSSSSATSIPVIFDPASFYGHDEFEFGIIEMFGGFDPAFFEGTVVGSCLWMLI